MLPAQSADRLTACDGVPDDHEWGDRLVLGADAVRMRNYDYAAAGDRSGEAHPAGAGREHQRPGRSGEIDAAVPGGVRRRRRLERP
jgi:hypothetical protein